MKTCKPQSLPLELVFAITRDVLVVFPTVKADNIIISPLIQIHIKSRLPLMESSHWPEPGQGQGMETYGLYDTVWTFSHYTFCPQLFWSWSLFHFSKQCDDLQNFERVELTFSRPEFDSTWKRCVDNKLPGLWIIDGGCFKFPKIST